MTGRLKAKFAPAFSRDLKKKAGKRSWDLTELEAVIDLILTNDAESMSVLKRRHNMHRLSGKWGGTTAVAVVKANGQFSAYSSGAYKKYLNGKSSTAVQAAVKDCVYGGVRNHSYYSFQATKKANSVKIGGNYYE